MAWSKGNTELGRLGERLAAERLTRDGYQILARNFRCEYGEMDLIAREGSELVFVEVKTRRSTAYGLPEEAVDARKQQRLIRIALYYLGTHELTECSWRIDVVAVQLSRSGVLEEIRVYRYAVTE
uniref:UPF0102 protein KTC_34100 n=1 Tax=Thermosporothrix sp. COM3 TaxID=2490863 RepID=A0A455SNU7_9CHLR|nr:UPF0102 protein [Thermosporothrix sp. COM3]